MPPLDFSRLPKWAQEHIRVLQMRLDERTDELNALGEQQPTRILIERWGADLTPTYLPDKTIVRFVVGEGWEQRVDVRINNEGELELLGGTQLVLAPSSSNVVRVGVRQR